MKSAQGPPEIALLVQLLDESYERKAWHGPNLKGSIRGLTAAQAAWKPGPARHGIAEITVHAAYWKYSVRRRLRGDRRGSFPLKGSNWFPLPEPLTDKLWREYVALLDAEHRLLRAALLALPPDKLSQVPPGSKATYRALVTGVASHDVYHAGQIQLLKKLRSDAVGRQ